MSPRRSSARSRRFAVTAIAANAASCFIPPVTFGQPATVRSRSPLERLRIAAIGLRYQGTVITEKARAHGDIVALCDVDRHVREQARASFGSTPKIFEDYRELLMLPDVDVVLIGTPDHWHSKMVIDSCNTGKHVYCEKPLTLTIDEGKAVRKATQAAKGIIQVGSWQRSDHRFRLAVEMVRSGRIGHLQTVDVVLGKNEVGGPFEKTSVPKHFNWNLWQGQTPDVPYIAERSHYTFRWWNEYSGGQMTDWGAHHVDIAQWAIDSLPVEVSGKGTFPNVADGYNVPIDFSAVVRYANGISMTISDTGRNGILFSGTSGRIFVNRGSITGQPVDALQTMPLPREQFSVYGHDNLSRPERSGKLDAIINHMGNFFDCIETGKNPISDVESQHRSATTCHLANIAIKLGRSVLWNPETELFIDDSDAVRLMSRPQRQGFETTSGHE